MVISEICADAPIVTGASRSLTRISPSDAVPPLGTSAVMSPSQLPSTLRVRSAALVRSIDGAWSNAPALAVAQPGAARHTWM